MRSSSVTLLLCAAFGMIAWAQPPRPAPAATQPKPTAAMPVESPVAFFYTYGASHPGGARAGLTCAVWEDGVVLYARSWTKPGENLELGKLAGPVSELLDQLRRDGLTETEPVSFGVPDGGRMLIGVRGRGSPAGSKNTGDPAVVTERLLVSTWDEVIMPGYGNNNKPDEAYRALAAGWFKTKITLASLVITQRHALGKDDAPSGEFRGYKVDESWQTPWLRGDAAQPTKAIPK